MKICVIHPKIGLESASRLADALGADLSNPFLEDRRDYRKYDVVFNYGCSRDIYAKKFINPPRAVATAKSKVATFEVLHQAQVPTVQFTTHKNQVPKDWGFVVCRESVDGARGEGLEYVERGDALPDAALYTEYFTHVAEYRIVVFNGVVVARYKKVVKKDGWHFILYVPDGFEQVDADCIKAAKAIGIDYVGFDVLENKKGACVILEANSAPLLTEEVLEAIENEFKKG